MGYTERLPLYLIKVTFDNGDVEEVLQRVLHIQHYPDLEHFYICDMNSKWHKFFKTGIRHIQIEVLHEVREVR
jgi:hypothetical protein